MGAVCRTLNEENLAWFRSMERRLEAYSGRSERRESVVLQSSRSWQLGAEPGAASSERASTRPMLLRFGRVYTPRENGCKREIPRLTGGGAAQTLGPLDGIPLAVKDNFCTAGVRTTAGSAMLKEHRPTYDATLVARWRAAGAVLMGKTNMVRASDRV